MVRGCGNTLQLTCLFLFIKRHPIVATIFLSLEETINVVHHCHNSGRQVACFGGSCKVSTPKMLGMSLIQGKHWGYPCHFWSQNMTSAYSDLNQYSWFRLNIQP